MAGPFIPPPCVIIDKHPHHYERQTVVPKAKTRGLLSLNYTIFFFFILQLSNNFGQSCIQSKKQ